MGSVPITPGSGTPIRTVSNAGVDGGAHQQIMTLADDTGDFLFSKAIPNGSEDGILVRPLPSQVTKTGFSMALSGSVEPEWGTVVKLGTGQAVNQTGGNLVVTTGTTVNSETIIRGLASFTGATRLRCRLTLSQRIANQQFFVELVDVIGDALAITISSATAVTVTIPNNPFTAQNVGQFMYLGGYTGTGTFIPGRYAISAVSGNNVTYTVAGFAAGSGTVSVFGWNYNHTLYDGTTATNTKWDTQRKGWNTGDSTLTINTTASPGHIMVTTQNDMQASFMDALVAPNAGIQLSMRSNRVENVADDIPLRVQIRIVNGSTAPASTTTLTIGQTAVSNWAPQDMTIQDVRAIAPTTALPVQVSNTPSVFLGGANNLVGAVGIGSTSRTGTFYTSTTTNVATVAKASAGDLQTLVITNTSASTQYVKVFNLTAVTLGTSAAVMDIPVTAGATLSVALGPNGQRFATGIAFAVTGGLGATNNTAGAGGVIVAMTTA